MLILNLFLFLVACGILWKASELVIKSVEKISHSLRISSFATSFLILGILTSLTEISVGINSIIDKQPQVFVGNLIGGSFVILLLIIPILSIFNKGIVLKNHLDPRKLFFFLILIISPSFVILDGIVSRYDALLVLLLYALFFYIFQRSERITDQINLRRLDSKTTLKSLGQIVVGALFIYIAGILLVDKTIYFADLIGISPLIISLLILSIGTNLPELTITVNSIKHKRSDIAFGDYVGSAATNAMLFGIFTLINGPFTLEPKGFDITFFIILAGYLMFFLFARSKNRISPNEGLLLLVIYIIFLVTQLTEIFVLSSKI